MKRLLKRLELICLVLMLSLSMTACGENEERETSKISKEEKSDKKDKDKDDDDEEDEDEDEDEKKSSKEEKESVAEPTPEPTADPQEEMRKQDEEALKILEEAVSALASFADTEDVGILEEARNKLDEINLRKCSPEMRRLVEEYNVVFEDLGLILDFAQSLMDFGNALSLINFESMVIPDNATLQDIEDAYYGVSDLVEEIEELETPQYLEHAINREIDILEKYQTILVEMACPEEWIPLWRLYCSNGRDSALALARTRYSAHFPMSFLGQIAISTSIQAVSISRLVRVTSPAGSSSHTEPSWRVGATSR